MQQAGDDAVAAQLADYRRSMGERESWTRRAGWLLASVDLQVLLHRLAHTDLQAQLEFHDRVTAFHTGLRRFYYPFIFHERQFGPAEFAQLPPYAVAPAQVPAPLASLAALALLAAAAMAAGAWRLRRAALP